MGRRVGINSLWLIAQPLLVNLVTLAALGYITRKLGRAGYGHFNDAFAFVAFFTPLANLGLRTVGVRWMAEDHGGARRVFASLFALRLALAGLVALFALGTAPWGAAPGAEGPIIALATLSMALLVVTQSLGDRFRASERMRPVAIADLVGGLGLTLLSVLALAFGFGLIGFTVAYVIGTAIGSGVVAWFYVRAFGWPSLRFRGGDARSLLSQARPFFLMQLVAGVTDKPVLDILILTRLFGAAVSGPYAAVALLVNRLGAIPQGVTGALFPAVAGGYAERRAEVEQTVRQSILTLLLATLPLAAAVTCFARPIVRLFFGEDFAEASPVLATFIWVVPLLGPNLLMYDCLSAVRRQNVAAGITLAGGLLLIGLYALAIPLYGPMGAAASTVAREAILFGVLLRQMRHSFTDPIAFRQLGKAALALAAMAAPMALVAGSPSLGLQGACGAAGAGLYALLLLKLGVLRWATVRELWASDVNRR